MEIKTLHLQMRGGYRIETKDSRYHYSQPVIKDVNERGEREEGKDIYTYAYHIDRTTFLSREEHNVCVYASIHINKDSEYSYSQFNIIKAIPVDKHRHPLKDVEPVYFYKRAEMGPFAWKQITAIHRYHPNQPEVEVHPEDLITLT